MQRRSDMSAITSKHQGKLFPHAPLPIEKDLKETSLSQYVGQILILGSSFSTIAVLVCSVVVSPWFAPLLIGVVAMAILGVKLIETEPDSSPSKQRRERVIFDETRRGAVLDRSAPRITRGAIIEGPLPTIESSQHPPVGLTNEGCNCWANSCLQFLMNIPTYREAVFFRKDSPLTRNMQRYLRAQALGETVASRVNTQEIRTFLSSRPRGTQIGTLIHRSSRRQEDVSEALEYIFHEAGLYNDVSEAYLDQPFHDVPRASPFIGLGFASAGENAPFGPHMAQYFDYLADGLLRRFRKFRGKAPSDLIVKQERFYRLDIVETGEFIQGKHLQKIDVPLRYQLPPEYTTEETEPTEYECDAFITHIGRSMNSGHYVAFLKKQDPVGRVTYWKCDDNKIFPILEETFLSEMKVAYFLHFKKV